MGSQNSRVDETGHAYKGSQRQIQDYVNEHTLLLDCAIASVLGADFNGEIEWVSPRREQRYAEFSDDVFLTALGLGRLASPMREFWPPGGPHWDALAYGSNTRQVFLVEAKSYPAELLSDGSKASAPSLAKIESALSATAVELGINNGVPPASWTKPLYQSANRLAHLYFLRRNKVDAFLLNICFVNDTHCLTPLNRWREALVQIKQDLGAGDKELPFVRDIFLPALA